MESEQYAALAAVQDKHWFYEHRRELIREGLLRAGVAPGGNCEILDYGAGAGANYAALAPFGNVTAVEPSTEGSSLLLGRGYKRVSRESLDALAANADWLGKFDVILVSYVLYHQGVPDPARALALLRKFAKPGAILLNLEPAFNSLYRRMDRRVHGARRFTEGSLLEAHRTGGWSPQTSFYVLPSLFPAAWLLARLESFKGDGLQGGELAEHKSGGSSFVNAGLRLWLRTGDALLRSARIPMGVGVGVISRAPGTSGL